MFLMESFNIVMLARIYKGLGDVKFLDSYSKNILVSFVLSYVSVNYTIFLYDMVYKFIFLISLTLKQGHFYI